LAKARRSTGRKFRSVEDADQRGGASAKRAIETKPSARLPLKLDSVLLASAKAQLHSGLIALLESASHTGWGTATAARTEGFEAAMVEYAKTILSGLADDIQGPEAEACLDQLRGATIGSIVDWILPRPEYFEKEPAAGFSDMSPSGEWEQRLEETYSVFRPQHPPATTSEDADAGAFRLYYVLRLRLEQHRDRFRRKLEGALRGAMVAIEPSIRARLERRVDVSSVQGQHKKGFPADAVEHRRVVEAARNWGQDWPDHLGEICAALEGRVNIPKGWRKHHGFANWRDVADMIKGDSQVKGSLVKYIQYRIHWCKKNSSRLSRS
jgi:hypothetical protein